MCQNCNSTDPFVVYQSQYSAQNCDSCIDPSCGEATNAKCVQYTGSDLPCSGVINGDNLETAIQKIDTKVCSVVGNYSTYNTYCLSPINTQQEFVETISNKVCSLASDLTQFITYTFPSYQVSTGAQIAALSNPSITCEAASVSPSDSLVTILNKYCFAIADLQYNTFIGDVNWSQCFTVTTPPTNLSEAFTVIIDQICSIANGTGTLPTFNNIGSCLPTPGANDSLVDTIGKIKTRLCQTGTFDTNSIFWGCLPSSPTDLQTTIQQLVQYVSDTVKNKLTFSSDFTITQNNPSQICQGLHVALTTPVVNVDRFVAATSSDSSPGTLQNKLQAGTNITFDYIGTPGKVIINAATTADTYQVKADTADDTPAFLDAKVNGVTNVLDGIAIGTYYNPLTKQVDFTPGIDWSTFINAFLVQVQNNTALKVAFCNIVNSCVVVPTCNSYTVSLTTAQIAASISATFNYVDCANTVHVITLVPVTSETITFCAITGSVNAPGLLVLDAGSCASIPPAPGSLTGYAINYGATPTAACAGGGGTTTIYSTDPQFGITVGLVNGQTYFYSDGTPFNGTAHPYWAEGINCRYGTINSSGVFLQIGNCIDVGGCGV